MSNSVKQTCFSFCLQRLFQTIAGTNVAARLRQKGLTQPTCSSPDACETTVLRHTHTPTPLSLTLTLTQLEVIKIYFREKIFRCLDFSGQPGLSARGQIADQDHVKIRTDNAAQQLMR